MRLPMGRTLWRMPEDFFRYITPSRITAYLAAGWRVIGRTRSPLPEHDGAAVAVVEWIAEGEPMEPGLPA